MIGGTSIKGHNHFKIKTKGGNNNKIRLCKVVFIFFKHSFNRFHKCFTKRINYYAFSIEQLMGLWPTSLKSIKLYSFISHGKTIRSLRMLTCITYTQWIVWYMYCSRSIYGQTNRTPTPLPPNINFFLIVVLDACRSIY